MLRLLYPLHIAAAAAPLHLSAISSICLCVWHARVQQTWCLQLLPPTGACWVTDKGLQQVLVWRARSQGLTSPSTVQLTCRNFCTVLRSMKSFLPFGMRQLIFPSSWPARHKFA